MREKDFKNPVADIYNHPVPPSYFSDGKRLSEREKSIPAIFFNEALRKLAGKYNMITTEEENVIIKIASRF